MISFKEFLSEGKEEAKFIRKLLTQELGLSSRDVSVKVSYGGTSSSVRVSIKTMEALVLKKDIEEIAKEKESYDTDEYSGEILGGGNTFIFTEIDWKFQDSLVTKIQDEVKKEAKGDLKAGDQVTIFKTFTVANNNDKEYLVSKKGGGQVATTYHPSGIGSAVLNLITKLNEPSLYKKIK